MADAVHTAERLKELQALPLDRKIQISQTRIIEWYQRNKGNVVVSFSGGKDSTVLLHLVRSIYPDVPAVFSNTGLEYPEIFRFVQTFPNVEIVRPNMVFSEVISTYGYPLIGKEVAEAIYYARRIRSQSVQVERERENKGRITLLKRLELLGSRKLAGGGLALQTGTPRTTDTSSTPAERRTDGQSSPTSGGGSQPGCFYKGNSQAGGGKVLGSQSETERLASHLANRQPSNERNWGGRTSNGKRSSTSNNGTITNRGRDTGTNWTGSGDDEPG